MARVVDPSSALGVFTIFYGNVVMCEMSKKTPQPMVIDFTASWCGPCQLIQPAVDEFAQKYSDVEFVKIDVDELHGVAEEFNIQATPTFMLMKEGKQVDKIVGAKKDDLRKKIEKHRPVLKMDLHY